MKPDVSVIVSTYNRANTLRLTLDSLLKQEGAPRYELVIVDNNSSDNTHELLGSYERDFLNVRHVFEKKQGLSYGRNAGINVAGSDLLAFTDDDVCVQGDWIKSIVNAANEYPAYGIFGGRVLPSWPEKPPSWLTRDHWSPLALVDYGNAQTISAANRRTLIGANMIIRRKVFEDVGLFAVDYQRVKDGIGSTEDQELQDRYWRIGGLGFFDPRIVVAADVQPERLTKQYHRKWHFAHGRMLARMRDPMIEGLGPFLLGIPQYMLRECVWKSMECLALLLTGNTDKAFRHEVDVRFYSGFVRERLTRNREERVAPSQIKEVV